LRSSLACAISLLICSSIPRLLMELSVFILALVFLNYLSSESREVCSLERVSWLLLVPTVLIRSPILLFPLVFFKLRIGRFSFFYYIINYAR
jgi:hypothetical protein